MKWGDKVDEHRVENIICLATSLLQVAQDEAAVRTA